MNPSKIFIVFNAAGVPIMAFEGEGTAQSVAQSRNAHTVQPMTVQRHFTQCPERTEQKNGILTSRIHCVLPADHDIPHDFGKPALQTKRPVRPKRVNAR